MTTDELRSTATWIDDTSGEKSDIGNELRAHADELEAVLVEMDATPLDDAVVTEQIQSWAKQLRGE